MSYFLRFFRLCIALTLVLRASAADALVRIDTQSIDLALKYGIERQGTGYANFLGSNWLEAEDGTLLNIYTPFMLIASKGFKSGMPQEPSSEDLKKLHKRYYSFIHQFTDPRNPINIKFAVSLFGETEDFATQYQGWIEGFGRGKSFLLKPSKQLLQAKAALNNNASVKPYEAVNAYYFRFDEVENLQDYTFKLLGPDGKIREYHIKNDRIF